MPEVRKQFLRVKGTDAKLVQFIMNFDVDSHLSSMFNKLKQAKFFIKLYIMKVFALKIDLEKDFFLQKWHFKQHFQWHKFIASRIIFMKAEICLSDI